MRQRDGGRRRVLRLHVKGMTCARCERLIRGALEDLTCVEKVLLVDRLTKCAKVVLASIPEQTEALEDVLGVLGKLAEGKFRARVDTIEWEGDKINGADEEENGERNNFIEIESPCES